MKKRNKQSILTTIIVIALVALTLVVVYAIYREGIKSNQTGTNTTLEPNNTKKEETEKDKVQENEKEEPSEDEYIGEEEQEVSNKEETRKSKDERAIELAKGEWGDDDSVSFSVEEKKGNIYYVAVKSDATVITWYEVNTETWEISEYY